MRGILCRSLRLELARGLGLALAIPALVAAAQAQGITTTTALTEKAGAEASCATANLKVSLNDLTVAVTGNTGVPAGTVTIVDGSGDTAVQLASAALSNTGQASFVLYLSDGPHSLTAVYAGDAAYAGSTSAVVPVTISSQCDSLFVVTAANLSPAGSSSSNLALTAGQSGTATVTVTPAEQFVAGLTGPAFFTLSCSGLPDQSSCGFTPENIEILPNQSSGVTSSMVVLTYAASTTSISPANRPGSHSAPIAWAIVLPGILGLGGLAFGTRRRQGSRGQVLVRGMVRRSLRRLSLMAIIALITLLGTTGCNPRYHYEHNGPPPNPGTPAGTYAVIVSGQYSNGVIATTEKTNFTLTVK